KYPFKCQLISSPFTEELLTKELQDLKTYDPSLPRTWYFFGLNNAWGYHDKQTHLQELEKNLSKIIKTLQNHPEIVVLMAPEQQAVWQEYCNKEEKTLNKINDFFLGQ